MPPLDPHVSAKMGTLQLMDDAITYRLSRLSLTCHECGPARRCAEHATDAHLIASYQDQYDEALHDILAGIDPGDIALIMQPGDTPTTAAALSLVILARLRELAASGPAVTELDGRPVMIELDGRTVIEHPLPTGTGHPGNAA